MEGEVGDILWSVKDSTKDFGLEGLAEPHSSMPHVQVGFRIVLYIVSLLLSTVMPYTPLSNCRKKYYYPHFGNG
jgi:hypothetical protein